MSLPAGVFVHHILRLDRDYLLFSNSITMAILLSVI